MKKEPIQVTARLDAQGQVQPLEFTWNDELHPVASTGRRWEDSDGQHVLVMDHRSRVYELVFIAREMGWYLSLPHQFLSKS
jgi:hypothetical protein